MNAKPKKRPRWTCRLLTLALIAMPLLTSCHHLGWHIGYHDHHNHCHTHHAVRHR